MTRLGRHFPAKTVLPPKWSRTGGQYWLCCSCPHMSAFDPSGQQGLRQRASHFHRSFALIDDRLIEHNLDYEARKRAGEEFKLSSTWQNVCGSCSSPPRPDSARRSAAPSFGAISARLMLSH